MRQLWKARGNCVCVCAFYEKWLMNTGVKDTGLLEFGPWQHLNLFELENVL